MQNLRVEFPIEDFSIHQHVEKPIRKRELTYSKQVKWLCMRIGVCGIACEKCPRMQSRNCPNGSVGCVSRENKFCKICNCAYTKGVKLCFECSEFPCETTKQGPISYDYCQYISGKP